MKMLKQQNKNDAYEWIENQVLAISELRHKRQAYTCTEKSCLYYRE